MTFFLPIPILFITNSSNKSDFCIVRIGTSFFQLVSTSNEPSSQKPSSLLPTLPPGSTRLYDWSLNKSDLQLENEMSTNNSSDSETSTEKPTPVKTSLSPVS